MYLKSLEEHANHLSAILGVLGKKKLYEKIYKCKLVEIDFILGACSLKRRGNGRFSKD